LLKKDLKRSIKSIPRKVGIRLNARSGGYSNSQGETLLVDAFTGRVFQVCLVNSTKSIPVLVASRVRRKVGMMSREDSVNGKPVLTGAPRGSPVPEGGKTR
jgi:hypothetical protein